MSVETVWGFFRLEDEPYEQIVKDVCKAIVAAVMPTYVKSPSADDFKRIANEFSRKWSLPNCLGAVGCKTMQLEAPADPGPYFMSENHRISIVALCDANYCFTVAEVNYLGSLGDKSNVFKESFLNKFILNNAAVVPPPSKLPKSKSDQQFNYFAVGGGNNYPLKENFLTPYAKASLSDKDEKLRYERRIFNYRLSRASRVVDNAFGVLAFRWQRLQKRLSVSPQSPADVVTLVQACICLHNFLMKTRTSNNNGMGTFGDSFGPNDRLSKPGRWRRDDSPFTDTCTRGNGNATPAAREHRDMLSKYLSYENTLTYQVANSNASKAPQAKKIKLA